INGPHRGPFRRAILESSTPRMATPCLDQKYIAGSLGIPLNHLVEKLETLPKGRPLLVYCAGGYRSSIAARLLERSGFDHVSEIAGGIAGWEAANLPIQTAQSLS